MVETTEYTYEKKIKTTVVDIQTQVGTAGAGLISLPVATLDIETETQAAAHFVTTDGKVDDVKTQVGTAGDGLTALPVASLDIETQTQALAHVATLQGADTKDLTQVFDEIKSVGGARKTVFATQSMGVATLYADGVWTTIGTGVTALKDTFITGLKITNSLFVPVAPLYRITTYVNPTHTKVFPCDLSVPVETGEELEFRNNVMIEEGEVWEVQVNCTTNNGAKAEADVFVYTLE